MDSDEEIPQLIESTEINSTSASTSLSSKDNKAAGSTRVPLTIICGFLGAGKSTLLKRILTERHGWRIAVIMNEFGDTADIEARSIEVGNLSKGGLDPDSLAGKGGGIGVSGVDDENDPNSGGVLELANGCLCCSIKDTGAAAIEALMRRKGAFDHILLECTGLADPGPIAAMFWHNEEYGSGSYGGLHEEIMLDGVVCVVDAVFGLEQMREDASLNSSMVSALSSTSETGHTPTPAASENAGGAGDSTGESLRQIASSDVIILNKIDLVPQSTVSETQAAIEAVNPVAPIHRTIRGELDDLGKILGIGAYGVEGGRMAWKDEQLRSSAHSECHSDEHHNEHDHTNALPHAHTSAVPHYISRGISSLQISLPPLSKAQMDAFDVWIRTVLWEGRLVEAGELPTALDNSQSSSPPQPSATSQPIQILRCKGLLVLQDGSQHVLQGVRSMYDISAVTESGGSLLSEASNHAEDASTNADTEIGLPDAGKVVLIGKGLGPEVRTNLEKALTI